MTFEELLEIVVVFWLCSGAESGSGELGDDEYRNYGDSMTQ